VLILTFTFCISVHRPYLNRSTIEHGYVVKHRTSNGCGTLSRAFPVDERSMIGTAGLASEYHLGDEDRP